jgi:peroxiredoxin (alkyl hydroperoxide reductase subunit C)
VEVLFPLIEDLKMEVARKYGMLQPKASTTQAVRAVFIVDPKAKIRAILYTLKVPTETWMRSRMLIALQKADKDSAATPANWQPGDDLIIPPPGSCGAAKERMASKEEGKYCLDCSSA